MGGSLERDQQGEQTDKAGLYFCPRRWEHNKLLEGYLMW